MSPAKRARRQSGEGGITGYATKKGPRYAILYYAPDAAGDPKRVCQRGFATRKDAAAALREINTKIAAGAMRAPSRTTVEGYLHSWLEGLRLRESTIASYRRMVELHICPHIGGARLDKLTAAQITAMYKKLEKEGNRRGSAAGSPLSARTVRYAHTILAAALKDAVADGLLAVSPAARAKPPSAASARAPEMHVWTPEQAGMFLAWATAHRGLWQVWHLLLHTGMRRGELCGLRWGDVDLDAGTLTVRRSVGVLVAGGKRTLATGRTKTGKDRVVDLDAGTVEVLRRWRAERGRLALQAARADAAVFAGLAGEPPDPDTLTARFERHIAAARRALGADALPRVRVHDLRHTHATALLKAGVPVKVVSERLGHTDVTTTLRTYQHVLPGMQRQAADAFASMLG